MKSKGGQFYLISSMIIVTLIIGIVAVSNYARAKPGPKIYNIKTELGNELEKVLEYKIYSGEDKTEDFAKDFSEYAGSTVKIYFIFSNPSDTNAFYYENGEKKILDSSQNGNEVNVSVGGIQYSFENTAKENAHFIIVENINNENYVATS
jgi:hypothetical protein